MRLSDSQVALLGEAATLISAHGDLLSAFELELMAEVASRFSRHCRDPEVTPAEWLTIEPAIEAMRAASQGDQQALERARTL